MTAGPITINNGVTITVNDGGSWSVVQKDEYFIVT